MNTFIKKNFALLLAFALPIVLIAIVTLSTYLPSLFLSTDYNFVYAVCTDGTSYYPYSCRYQRYTVSGGKLVMNEVDAAQDSDKDGIPDAREYTSRIFLHDTQANESREIAFEEAQSLDLNSLLTSPDGLTVASHYDRNSDIFFLFGGNTSHGYYLTKGRSKTKLNLINDDDRYYYRDNFQFLGWVLPGR